MTQYIQDSEYYITKLLNLPEQFEDAFWKKEYPKAKYIYDTAIRVAGFLEVPENIKTKLFINHQEGNTEVEALFNVERVRKAYEMSAVRSHQAVENESYRRYGQAPRYYPEPRYPAETKK